MQISGLTASEIVITDASKNLASAAVATYPSLTELSYVKGLSSAVQTQITAKAPSTAPTFATSITGSYLTASEILITDGSKNIVSAAVATYPSLTELSYVKGVTSAIQTQLGTKAATLAGTINEIAYFNSSSTIASLTAATYPSLTELSYVKGVTSAIQTQINAKGAGTVTAVSVATANGVSGSSSGGATPALTITLGAITPSSVAATGAISTGANAGTIGSVKLFGNTSGDVTLTPNAIAGTGIVLTLPATAGTLVTGGGTASGTNTGDNAANSSAIDGWTDDTAHTWTYASASTFTIAGVDLTSTFTKGTRLKFTQTTVKYAVVVASSFSTNTTVTIAVNTDYTIANAAITLNYYSYQANPQGYPTWFNFDTTVTWTAGTAPSGSPIKKQIFCIVGNQCLVNIFNYDYAAGATVTVASVPLPIAAANIQSGYGMFLAVNTPNLCESVFNGANGEIRGTSNSSDRLKLIGMYQF